jgi:hypothetical protein
VTFSNRRHGALGGPFALLAGIILSLAACDNGDGDQPDTSSTTQATTSSSGSSDGSTSTLASSTESDLSVGTGPHASDPRVQVGAFSIKMVAPTPATGSEPAKAGYTSIFGRVSDGPSPELIVWEQSESDGDCQLLVPRVPICDTPCGGSAACIEDNVCQDYPHAQSIGTVEVSGLSGSGVPTTFPLQFVANNYQLPANIKLDEHPFDADDEISLHARGSFTPAFDLRAHGIDLLTLTPTDFSLTKETAIAIDWNAPADPSRSSIVVRLDISHHGGSKGKIVCTTADDGHVEIGATLVTHLLDLGVAGFPTIIIERHSVSQTQTPQGTIEVNITSAVEQAIAVDGLLSCNEDSDCPPGQTCKPDLTCGGA